MMDDSSFSGGFGGGGLRRRTADEGPARLNITSMMDMFTIMLIFLLINFAPDSADLKLEDEMTLPTSTSELPYETYIKIALTRSELLVGDDVVAGLENGRLVGTHLDGDVIVALKAALVRQRSKIDSAEEAIVLFYADKDAQYDLVDKVMRTTASAGFPNFKFAVNGN